MYGYEEYIDLTPNQVLQKITQEQIFEFILRQPFNFSNRYISPLRSDKKPGCRFERREDGVILFVDFGERNFTGRTHRTCFSMLMEMENVDLYGAIRILCQAFQLSTDKENYTSDVIIGDYTTSSIRRPAFISYVKQPFTRADKIYWSAFNITIEQLKEDNVYSVEQFTITGNKGKHTITPYGVCFALDFISRVKIYQPTNSLYRFTTNCHEDDIGNWNNLPSSGEELIIQKSYKDHRVVRNCLGDVSVIWLQNEGCIPSDDVLYSILSRFKLITIFYDSDLGGVRAARALKRVLDSIVEGKTRLVFLPRRERDLKIHKRFLKDPGLFISKEGQQDCTKILKQILYGKVA